MDEAKMAGNPLCFLRNNGGKCCVIKSNWAKDENINMSYQQKEEQVFRKTTPPCNACVPMGRVGNERRIQILLSEIYFVRI
jgi:hypothetical protein